MNNFKIYTPVNKFYFTNNAIVLFTMALCLLPTGFEIILLQHENHEISTFSKIIFLGVPIAMLAGVILIPISYKKYAPLKGIIKDDIIFENDKIIINDRVIKIEELNKLDFFIGDYRGKRNIGDKDFNGKIANGVNNYISYYLKDNKKEIVYFQLQDEYAIRNISEQLVQYHLAGKLHFLNLIDILGISDYDDIQLFKKDIAKQIKKA